MIREINASEITKTVREMCIKVNHFLSEDMDNALKKATENEKSDLGKKILDQLQENSKIAGEDMSGYRNGSIVCRGWTGCSCSRWSY